MAVPHNDQVDVTEGRSSKTFLADPASAREARRFVSGWLRAQQLDALVDRVALAVSELVANAVLHTAQPFTVTVDNNAALARLEVVDSAPDRLPIRVPRSGSAVDITSSSATGRGLQIVSALANRWGVVLSPNVKSVWCEFDPTGPTSPSDPTLEDERPPTPRPPGVLQLHFLGLPVRASIASGLEVDDAIRDVQLRPNAASEELLDLVERSAPLRLAGRHAAMHAAGQNKLHFDLEVEATDDILAAVAGLNDALAKLPPRHRGDAGPSDEVIAFRAWLTDETLRQRRGLAPTPHPGSLPDDWLWDQSGCAYVAVDLAGRLLRANALAHRWFDVDDPDVVPRIASLVSVDAPRVSQVPVDFARADGTTLHAHVSAVTDGAEVRAVIAGPDESERSQALVRALQQTLIPPAPPSVSGLDVAAAYHPALGEVGGDFFDVFEVADGDWCVVLGDVSGKGVEAAIVTSEARHAVRSHALREPAPSDLMRALNRALVQSGGSRFCTVALLRLQHIGGAWVATLTSGGHPYPLLIRHGTATKLGRPGSLLGVFDDVNFHDVSIKLAVGDALVLYTDGVTEARNEHGEFYGDDRMYQALTGAAYSAQAMVDALVASVLEFQAGTIDDIAVVVVRRPEL